MPYYYKSLKVRKSTMKFKRQRARGRETKTGCESTIGLDFNRQVMSTQRLERYNYAEHSAGCVSTCGCDL